MVAVVVVVGKGEARAEPLAVVVVVVDSDSGLEQKRRARNDERAVQQPGREKPGHCVSNVSSLAHSLIESLALDRTMQAQTRANILFYSLNRFETTEQQS